MDSILFYIFVLLLLLFYISEKHESFTTILNLPDKVCNCKKNNFCYEKETVESRIACVENCNTKFDDCRNKPGLVSPDNFNNGLDRSEADFINI